MNGLSTPTTPSSSPPLPRRILILRHGEKPGDPTAEGSEDGINLSTRGYERAGALAPYVPGTFGAPDYLFATAPSKHSNRPVETITPLANALGLKIHADYADADFQKLADHILGSSKYAGKLLLICWHHGKIPALTSALKGLPPFSPWPGHVFDRVWQIDYAQPSGPGASTFAVANMPQQLLYGDSAV